MRGCGDLAEDAAIRVDDGLAAESPDVGEGLLLRGLVPGTDTRERVCVGLQVASPDHDALKPDLDEPGEVLIDPVEEVDVFDQVMRAESFVAVVAVGGLCGSLGDSDLFCVFAAFRASRTWTSRISRPCGSGGRSEFRAIETEGAMGCMGCFQSGEPGSERG